MSQSTSPVVAAEPAASRYRWYVLFVLTAAQACHYLDRTIIGLVVEPVRSEFGLSDGQIGLLSGLAYGIAFALAAIPLGWLVDRSNRRNLLAIILSLWSGLTMVCGLAQNYLTLLLSRMAVGAAEAGGSPTGMSILADYFGPRERSSAIAIWYASAAFGVMMTFLVGGYIAEHYGWRYAFFFAGIPGLLVAVLILATLKEPVRGAMELQRSDFKPLPPGRAALYLLRRPAVVHCMMGIILAGLTVSGFSIWTVSYFTRQHGLDLSQAGVVAAVALGICGAIGGIACGLVADRLNSGSRGYQPKRIALLCAATASLSILVGVAALLANSFWVAMGIYFAYAMLNTAHNGPANALLLSLVGPHMRGFTISAVQMSANLISWGMGPLIVGLLSDLITLPDSLRWALILTLMINIWAALHFVLASRHGERDLERLGEA